jgi:2'-5' RNA ligase
VAEYLATRRLFFACWPDEDVRSRLIARRGLIEGISGRRVPDHNLHLTLLFLGNQPAGGLPALLAAIDAASAAGFTLILDRFGWFAGAKVAWLGGPAPEAARELVGQLLEIATEKDLRFDHRPFHPHVTLFRRVACRPEFPEPPALAWPIKELALIESIPSRPYQVLRTWPLSV